MISNRKFGIEIEFVGDQGAAVLALRAVGIDVNIENYNHTTREHWKIVDDSSIQEAGGELVSPPLSGTAGLDEVRRAVTALQNAGFLATSKCGLHVHVDANDFTARDIVAVVKRYARFQENIDRVMPVSRRGSRTHIGPVDAQLRTLEGTLSRNPSVMPRGLVSQITERYVNVNLCAFVRQGTIEFRQHSGTTDPVRVANWIVFCVSFMDGCKGTMEIVQSTAPWWEPTASQIGVGTPGLTLGELVRSRLAQNNTAAPAAIPAAPPPPAQPEGPGAPLRIRANSIDHRFAAMYNLLAANLGWSVSASRLASAAGIGEASVPSYISMLRDRFPQLNITARRGRGYVMPYLPNPVPAALGGPVPPTVSAPAATPPVAPATVESREWRENPTAATNPFEALPMVLQSYYRERANEFGHTHLF